MTTTVKSIHVFVEVGKDKKKIEFDTDTVTGRDIKVRAEVPLDSDLGQRVEGKVLYVPDTETITLKNGDHFIVLPPGTIS